MPELSGREYSGGSHLAYHCIAGLLDPDEAPVDDAGLIAHCREHLAGYKCPKRIEFRDELARTATGKLQKFKLRQPYWEGYDRQVN